jgi:hypothetical protein
LGTKIEHSETILVSWTINRNYAVQPGWYAQGNW